MSASAGLSRTGAGSSPGASPNVGLLPNIDPPYEGWSRPDPGPGGYRADLIAAVALCVAAVLTLPLYPWAGLTSPTDAPMWLELIWSGALCLPIAWRRRQPLLVAATVSAIFIAGGIAFGVSLFFHNIALFVAFYTVGAWEPNRARARWTRVIITAAMFVWLMISIFIYATGDAHQDEPAQTGPFSPLVSVAMIQLLTNAVFFAGAYYLGDRAFGQAVAQDALDRQSQELARERERSTAQAITLERVRIARELHDVVAHHVSVMGVQASAARMAIDRDHETARHALGNVEDSARSAISELRGILTTLRDPDGDSVPRSGLDGPSADDTTDRSASDAAATVGTRRLPELIGQANAAGLPTRLEVIGTRWPLSAVTDVNIYRIVQEALTNVRKHAGPHATADVRLRFYADQAEIEITNGGSIASLTGNRLTGAGLGQRGMRERVAASAGTIELGPLHRGGYLVRARMPLQPPATDPDPS
ncbi:sensor histidine kinase [Microlunatus soli]|uniref:histidine kinase n=1 Tax=Microlunatus soli TaxID=630515 RepID=A0A1H1SZH1_9ACTN|nr:histidine kinase [Microlunatus soli]SDS53370.1 Signal transduction histidine kinase [Microlunatus soli]